MYGTHTLAFQRIFVRMKIISLIFIRFSVWQGLKEDLFFEPKHYTCVLIFEKKNTICNTYSSIKFYNACNIWIQNIPICITDNKIKIQNSTIS
jgi:hypothetical protein